MSKMRALFVLALVGACAESAYGNDTPVSYHVTGISNNDITIVDSVPSGGFILTDIVAAESGSNTLTIKEDTGGGLETRFITRHNPDAGASDGIQVHLQTGIPFSAGSRITARCTPANIPFTFIGYIPGAPIIGKVPAVGTWGLSVMVLLILIAATMVLRQRRVATV